MRQFIPKLFDCMKGYTKEIMEQALGIVQRNIPNAKLRGL